MTTVRIDPPRLYAGEQLCRHDMLIFGGRSTCAICRRLPDVPTLDLFEPLERDDRPRHAWFLADRSGRCRSCDKGYGLNSLVTYAPTHGGLVGECCAGIL